uniref:Uncharacterized protein n=1 Tax=Acrobeloides nanus TaxID=290746 RepID=A0A914DZ68_9BILA
MSTGLNFLFISMYFYFVSLSFALIPVPFVYRYLVLIKERDIEGFAYLKLYIVPFAVTSIHMVYTSFLYYPSDEKIEFAKILFHGVFMENGSDHWNVGYVGTPIATRTSVFDMSVICNGSYSVVFWCSMKIYKNLKGKMAMASAKTRDLQSQLTRIMIAQAVGPMVVFMLPVLFYTYCIVSQADQIALSITFGLPLAWIPLANPVVTIWFMKPYRNTIFPNKSVTSIQNISSTQAS